MQRSLGFALIGAACLCASPVSARPIDCAVDASQPLTGRGFYFSADTERWQEFVPAGDLVCEVQIELRVDQLGGDLLLRIEDDLGTIRGQSSIDASELVLGTGSYSFEFASVVTTGTLHRLVLSTDQPDVFPAPCFWLGDEASSYDSGTSDVHFGGIPGFDYAFEVSTGSVTTAPAPHEGQSFVLHDAVPNPFNPSTTISFEMKVKRHVRLTIHDVAGRFVATLVDRPCDVGSHEFVWSGRDTRHRLVASGVYLFKIDVGEVAETRRAVLLK